MRCGAIRQLRVPPEPDKPKLKDLHCSIKSGRLAPLMGNVCDTPGALLCVVGARPNYMKMAPLLRSFRDHASLPPAVLVHTGQHYDPLLNDRLFQDLGLPRPDINLEVGSASHAVQTAEVMRKGGKRGRMPELWDGGAAERIAAHLAQSLRQGAAAYA